MDKVGLMTVVGGLDPGRGLDLLVHTPGGDTAATESIAHYLRARFGSDLRVIVPQARALGRHGPLLRGPRGADGGAVESRPDRSSGQRPPGACRGRGVPTGRARDEGGPRPGRLWRPILEQYDPTMVGECEKAIAWSREVARDLLRSGMFSGAPDADARVDRVLHGLIDHPVTKAHARHLPIETVREMGFAVQALEEDRPSTARSSRSTTPRSSPS